jgi:hypothetical protein
MSGYKFMTLPSHGRDEGEVKIKAFNVLPSQGNVIELRERNFSLN